jgi:hypothetical protein
VVFAVARFLIIMTISATITFLVGAGLLTSR